MQTTDEWYGKAIFIGAMSPYVWRVSLGVSVACFGMNTEIQFLHDALVLGGIVVALFSFVLAVIELTYQCNRHSLQLDVVRKQNGLLGAAEQSDGLIDTRRLLPKDGGETPTPEFLETLWGIYYANGKVIPGVRDDCWKPINHNPQRVQAMFTRLVTWGAIIGRTERGASGTLSDDWTHALCRQRMVAEQPDYAPILPVKRD